MFVRSTCFQYSFLYTFRYGQIARAGGIGSLWKGFPVVAGGMIPAQVCYVTTLELSKHSLKGHVPDTFTSFIAGKSMT